MPVVFNEPLSFLQRMLEYLEYAHLLRMASEQTDPVARMEYIAGEELLLSVSILGKKLFDFRLSGSVAETHYSYDYQVLYEVGRYYFYIIGFNCK